MTSGVERPARHPDNLWGAGWLIADMSLNIWALSLVKALGTDHPAIQIVFIRAAVGLVLLLPVLWRERGAFAGLENHGLHLLRVLLSVVTLSASFFAISRLSFALFSAINFTRPILLMLLAALLLRERIGGWRWVAGGIGLAGAVVATAPGSVDWNWGLVSLCLSVFTGTLAIILTRRLKGTPAIVMMVFYTGGLCLASAPFAVAVWEPVAGADAPLLIAIGVFAQAAQVCFLRAHWLADAGVLGPVSYVSLALSATAGYLVFGEIPTMNLLLGATLIILSCLWLTRLG